MISSGPYSGLLDPRVPRDPIYSLLPTCPPAAPGSVLRQSLREAAPVLCGRGLEGYAGMSTSSMRLEHWRPEGSKIWIQGSLGHASPWLGVLQPGHKAGHSGLVGMPREASQVLPLKDPQGCVESRQGTGDGEKIRPGRE